MRNRSLIYVMACLSFLICKPLVSQKKEVVKVDRKTHRFGGWYCPDNLYGFPAVSISDWFMVPVIKGRLPTKAEVQTESSLIFVDTVEYPNAKALDINLPRLGTIYNQSTNRDEFIIVIQCIEVQGDSIVGFRYLNGGNGSSYLHEIEFLDNYLSINTANGKFVDLKMTIGAFDTIVWSVVKNAFNNDSLVNIIPDKGVSNFYLESGLVKAKYANDLYGCYYVQNDYNINKYTEKLLLCSNDDGGTDVRLTFGPFKNDHTLNEQLLKNWLLRIKDLSEEH